MPTYHGSVTPNAPEFSQTGKDQNNNDRTVSGLLQVYGASFAVLDKHWSLSKCRDGNYIEAGWCPAPPGRDLVNLPLDLFARSVMWLRLMFYPAFSHGTLVNNLHLEYKFEIVGTPSIEFYVGTKRVVPPGTIPLQSGLVVQPIDLTNILAVDVLNGCNVLDILVRVCSAVNPVQGTFNFKEISGDLII